MMCRNRSVPPCPGPVILACFCCSKPVLPVRMPGRIYESLKIPHAAPCSVIVSEPNVGQESFSFSFYVPWRESGSGQTVCDDAEDSFCPGACHSCLEDDTILGISERNRGSHGFKLICDLAGSEFPGSSDEETCGSSARPD